MVKSYTEQDSQNILRIIYFDIKPDICIFKAMMPVCRQVLTRIPNERLRINQNDILFLKIYTRRGSQRPIHILWVIYWRTQGPTLETPRLHKSIDREKMHNNDVDEKSPLPALIVTTLISLINVVSLIIIFSGGAFFKYKSRI